MFKLGRKRYEDPALTERTQILKVCNIIYLFLQKAQLGAMLDEDPALMEKRTQIAKRLELYKQARDDIDSVAWK